MSDGMPDEEKKMGEGMPGNGESGGEMPGNGGMGEKEGENG